MADILQILQQFLCYGNSDCINMFNSYTYKPMEGLFYLVLFPTVFIIIFIYLLARRYFPDHRGLNLLISIVFFAFIILQGWYHIFMMLGQIWYIAVMILGILWVFLYGLLGKKNKPGAQGRTGLGVGGLLGKRAWARVSGQEEALVKAIEADLDLLSKMSPDDKEIGEVSGRLYQQIQQLYSLTSIGGLKVGKAYDKLLKEYHNIMKKMKISSPGPELPKKAT